MKKSMLKSLKFNANLVLLIIAPMIAHAQASLWFWQEPKLPEQLKTKGE